MIPALEAAGFFLAITAALQFSNWAEGWLSSTSRSKKERASDEILQITQTAPLLGIESID